MAFKEKKAHFVVQDNSKLQLIFSLLYPTRIFYLAVKVTNTNQHVKHNMSPCLWFYFFVILIGFDNRIKVSGRCRTFCI